MPKILDVTELPYFIGIPVFHSYFQNNKFYFTFRTVGTRIYLSEGIIEHGTFLGENYEQRSIDFYLPMLDWYCHCIQITSLYNVIRKIISDLANMSVVFIRYQETLTSEYDIRQIFLLEADLEFFFFNIRSLFDLTQYFYQQLWKNSFDSKGNPPAKTLPDSFARMVLSGNNLLSVDEIVEKYSIPKGIAQIYSDYGNFFRNCRDVRDQVVHYGKKIESVHIKDGMAFVDVTRHPFNKFSCWESEKIDDNNLGELQIFLKYLLNQVMDYLEALAIALNTSYSQQAIIHPEWKMYVCHPLFPVIKEILEEANES
ncbi:hypothetical protein KQH40_01175 [bacterium]|nr:hypothetical protein [bacterium]